MKTAKQTLVWLVSLLLLMAAGLAFTFRTYSQIEQASNHRRDSRVVMGVAEELLYALVDAENGQRGFAITVGKTIWSPTWRPVTACRGMPLRCVR